jgi:hypothetical protein
MKLLSVISCSRRAVLTAALATAVLMTAPALAQSTDEVLTVAWEALWQQTGYLTPVRRWGGPIRVRFTPEYGSGARAHAIAQLKLAAEVAGIEVTEASDDSPNLEVAIDLREARIPTNAPCNTSSRTREGIIVSSTVRANPQSIYRCMLHEAMHVMGFSGHPMGRTVLTYFARGTSLTDIDRLLLRTLYSSEITPGMSPFQFMSVLARHLEAVAVETEKGAVRAANTHFLQRTLKDMEAFAAGTGEPPAVLFRSSKASGDGIARGQVVLQFYLGDAYLNGYWVERDRAKAVEWLSKAALASHAGARRTLDGLAAEAKP